MLSRELTDRAISHLLKIPGTAKKSGRDSLLVGMEFADSLDRDPDSKRNDLFLLLDQLDKTGCLKDTGERPVIVLVENARQRVPGTTLAEDLARIVRELEEHYRPEELVELNAPIPEILVFEERDERLGAEFFKKALVVGRGVARLRVPRCSGGLPEGRAVAGTGWLVAPGLLFTANHVVEARKGSEPRPAAEDKLLQARNTTAWFDYHREGGPRVEYRCIDLVCSDGKLDYALLRIEPADGSDSRKPLSIVPKPVSLSKKMRLNIVQHSGGEPMKFAVRNNFFVGTGNTDSHIRYITDTERGASGAPVLSDTWDVLCMHQRACPIPEEQYQGDIVKYHNEGTKIHAILDHLPSDIRDEIGNAQQPDGEA